MMAINQQYRTQANIVGDVLSVIMEGGRGGVIISRIRVRANLSYASATERCENLESAGLIKYTKKERKNFYAITEKGIKFLRKFQNY